MTIDIARRKKIVSKEVHRIGGDVSLVDDIFDAAHDRLGLPLALGLIQVESNFRNVYGHDRVRNPIKSPPNDVLIVTHHNYAEYAHYRDMGQGNQGVGPGQLTAKEFQVRADRLGGCWIPKSNLLVAYADLDAMIQVYGRQDGIAAYNAGPGGRHGSIGQHYSQIVRDAADHFWNLIK